VGKLCSKPTFESHKPQVVIRKISDLDESADAVSPTFLPEVQLTRREDTRVSKSEGDIQQSKCELGLTIEISVRQFKQASSCE